MQYKSIVFGVLLRTAGHIVFKSPTGDLISTSVEMPNLLTTSEYYDALRVRDQVEKCHPLDIENTIHVAQTLDAISYREAIFLYSWLYHWYTPLKRAGNATLSITNQVLSSQKQITRPDYS